MLFEADYAKNYASIMYQCLVVARKLTFSNKVSELLDGALPAPRWLFHYITVTGRWLVAYSDREKIAQVTQSNIREVLQHVILAKKPYERRLRGATPILYVILERKPRNERPRYGLST